MTPLARREGGFATRGRAGLSGFARPIATADCPEYSRSRPRPVRPPRTAPPCPARPPFAESSHVQPRPRLPCRLDADRTAERRRGANSPQRHVATAGGRRTRPAARGRATGNRRAVPGYLQRARLPPGVAAAELPRAGLDAGTADQDPLRRRQVQQPRVSSTASTSAAASAATGPSRST